jgi:hypothetical protein
LGNWHAILQHYNSMIALVNRIPADAVRMERHHAQGVLLLACEEILQLAQSDGLFEDESSYQAAAANIFAQQFQVSLAYARALTERYTSLQKACGRKPLFGDGSDEIADLREDLSRLYPRHLNQYINCMELCLERFNQATEASMPLPERWRILQHAVKLSYEADDLFEGWNDYMIDESDDQAPENVKRDLFFICKDKNEEAHDAIKALAKEAIGEPIHAEIVAMLEVWRKWYQETLMPEPLDLGSADLPITGLPESVVVMLKQQAEQELDVALEQAKIVKLPPLPPLMALSRQRLHAAGESKHSEEKVGGGAAVSTDRRVVLPVIHK